MVNIIIKTILIEIPSVYSNEMIGKRIVIYYASNELAIPF